MKRGPAPTWIPLRRQLLDSSIWEENAVVCKLWVTLLIVGSEPGRRGTIDMTERALAARACMTIEEVSAALEVLMAPDPRSRSRVAAGRRLEPLESGRTWGWRLVNWEAYERTMAAAGSTARARARRSWNATECNGTSRNVTEPTKEKDKEKEREKKKEKEKTPPFPPHRGARAADARFDAFYEGFPNRVKRPEAAKAWETLSDADRDAALAGVAVYADAWRAAPADRLPFAGNPATWLRNERWKEDREAWERAAAPRNGGARTGAAVRDCTIPRDEPLGLEVIT